MIASNSRLAALGLACALVFAWACGTKKSDTTPADADAPHMQTGDTPVNVIPAARKLDPRRVALGKRLFDDARLSADDTIACSSCHVLEHGGSDGRRYSIGIGGRKGKVNAPTVFNADFNAYQFWDGRAASLEEQIDGPITNPAEMGSEWTGVVAKIGADESYRTAFSAIYRDGVTRTNIKDAIATFERALTSEGSRFDAYIGGNKGAITAEEREGYETFEAIGCGSCHQGRNVGGNLFERIGVMEDYFAARGEPITDADLGRYNVTKRADDKFRFRVPSLRLASMTAPYFHDGSMATLDDAIAAMGRYQLGLTLSAHDIGVIKAFIGSLTNPPRIP